MQPNTSSESTAVALYFGDELQQMAEVRAANLGPQAMLRPKELIKVPFPGAGALAFTITGGDEPLTLPEFDGVILAWQSHWGYFKDKYEGGNEPPDCFAEMPAPNHPRIGSKPVTVIDGDLTYGGACAACPVGQWRVENGRKIRPACRERIRVYVQTKLFALPVWLDLPSTSVPVFKEYMQALTRFNLAHHWVVTTFALERVEAEIQTSKGIKKIPYAKLKPRVLRVPGDDRKTIFTLSNADRVSLAPWRGAVLSMIDPAERAARAAQVSITEEPGDDDTGSAAAAYGVNPDADEVTEGTYSEDEAPAITADL